MANRKELREARRRADYAVWALQRIEMLPRRKGAQVVWSNGVVWIRHGDDDWRTEDQPDWGFSSEHVATVGVWESTSNKAAKP